MESRIKATASTTCGSELSSNNSPNVFYSFASPYTSYMGAAHIHPHIAIYKEDKLYARKAEPTGNNNKPK